MDFKLLRRQIYSPMDTPQTAVSQFVRNCLLFFRLPIDFLLTFQDSKDIVPAVKPINKEAHIVGMKLRKELKEHASGGMRIYFFGSNFFQLPGINDDLDFLVEYATEKERKKWTTILKKYFGKPAIESRKFTKWETTYKGFEIEVLLSHPRYQIFRSIYDGYNALCSDKELLAGYENLKHNSVGITQREYNRRQLYFFRYYAKNNKLRAVNKPAFTAW